MLWGKKVLRITAAVAVAFAAAHTAENRKGQDDQQPLVLAAAPRAVTGAAPEVLRTGGAVPESASLSTTGDATLDDLIGITPVAAMTSPTSGDTCQPSLDLSAMPGALIQLTLSAPCNRGQRIFVRHSGLSFAAKTGPDGAARILFPAMRADAAVAVYLGDAQLVLGHVSVPEVEAYARYAIVWEEPAELELRVTDGNKVLVGSPAAPAGERQRVMALGSSLVQSRVMAHVYSVPGRDLGAADLTAELRITPASCGRTLRLDTVYSAGGQATIREQEVAVPLCGTAGDILLLKNLAPDMKLAAPK